ncbi:caspase recruitment domain-containing protein 8-like [Leuresthes tenuis]|uniref:caspase recruitment domain-containing protein 8-like n=1 Tax=Leuresthes tenuis TaxID=355514 RepID=UPI003B50313D
MKRRLRSTSSLVSQGQGTSTDPSEEKKKILPVQKDEITNTDSKSQTCTESAGIHKSDDSSIDALFQGNAPFMNCKDSDWFEHQLHNTDVSDGADKFPGETDKLPNYFSPSCQNKIPQLASPSRPSLTEPQNLCTKAENLFTPDFTEDFDDETYRFQCSSPGLYQCEVTGLVFHMEGEGKVLYRIFPWNRRLLSQHHKKPAGPLFDIKCLQQSVCQLHLPHCEILSTGACNFLSVAHMTDEGIEFISPHKITETHVIINITGFSGLGNVKDEDSPPDPVQALILLFYKLPDDHNVRSLLNVLLVPRNIVIRDLQRTRRKLIGNERYIDVSPYCKLQPKQTYSLSSDLGSELVKVQPTEAEFDEGSYNSYFTSFQVILKTKVEVINLKVENKSSSCCVWEREVCLFPSTVRAQSVCPVDRLLEIRRSFIEGISGAVLQSLVDKLLQTKVITDSEREAAEERQSRRDKARYVIDTVRGKGDAASSTMIQFLCEADPYFCEYVGLTKEKYSGETNCLVM